MPTTMPTNTSPAPKVPALSVTAVATTTISATTTHSTAHTPNTTLPPQYLGLQRPSTYNNNNKSTTTTTSNNNNTNKSHPASSDVNTLAGAQQHVQLHTLVDLLARCMDIVTPMLPPSTADTRATTTSTSTTDYSSPIYSSTTQSVSSPSRRIPSSSPSLHRPVTPPGSPTYHHLRATGQHTTTTAHRSKSSEEHHHHHQPYPRPYVVQRSSTDSITVEQNYYGEPQSPNTAVNQEDGGQVMLQQQVSATTSQSGGEEVKSDDNCQQRLQFLPTSVADSARSPSMFDAVSSGRNSDAFMHSETTSSVAPSPTMLMMMGAPAFRGSFGLGQPPHGGSFRRVRLDDSPPRLPAQQSMAHTAATTSKATTVATTPHEVGDGDMIVSLLPVAPNKNNNNNTTSSFVEELQHHIATAQQILLRELFRVAQEHQQQHAHQHQPPTENSLSISNVSSCGGNPLFANPNKPVVNSPAVQTPECLQPPLLSRVDSNSLALAFRRGAPSRPRTAEEESFSVYVFPPPAPHGSGGVSDEEVLGTHPSFVFHSTAHHQHHPNNNNNNNSSAPVILEMQGDSGLSLFKVPSGRVPLSRTQSSSARAVASLPMWPRSPLHSVDHHHHHHRRSGAPDYTQSDFIPYSDFVTSGQSSPIGSLIAQHLSQKHNNLPNFARITSFSTTRDESHSPSDIQSVQQAALQLTSKLLKDRDESTGEKTINQYLILDTIGEGACGKVKLAYSLERNITVAIKSVRRAIAPDEGRALGRRKTIKEDTVRREISLMKRLRHPNLVSLFEVIDDPTAKKLYLVMRFADKGSVGAMRDDLTCDAMPLRALVDMTFQVCCGLQYLHERGIYHRDIKPENILQTSDGQYLISDFGISVERRRRSTSSSNNSALSNSTGILYDHALGIGTPLFMAPELLVYDASERSDDENAKAPDERHLLTAADMWALGVTIMTLWFGRWPFEGAQELRQSPRQTATAAAETFARCCGEASGCESSGCHAERSHWSLLVSQLTSVTTAERPAPSVLRKASKQFLRSLCDKCSALRMAHSNVPALTSVAKEELTTTAATRRGGDEVALPSIAMYSPAGSWNSPTRSSQPSMSTRIFTGDAGRSTTNHNHSSGASSTNKSSEKNAFAEQLRYASTVTVTQTEKDDGEQCSWNVECSEDLNEASPTQQQDDGGLLRGSSNHNPDEHLYFLHEDALGVAERQGRQQLRRQMTMYDSWSSHPHSARSSLQIFSTTADDDCPPPLSSLIGGNVAEDERGAFASPSSKGSIPHPPPLLTGAGERGSRHGGGKRSRH